MEADLRKKNSSLPFLYIEKIKPFLLLIHKRKSKINLKWQLNLEAVTHDCGDERCWWRNTEKSSCDVCYGGQENQWNHWLRRCCGVSKRIEAEGFITDFTSTQVCDKMLLKKRCCKWKSDKLLNILVMTEKQFWKKWKWHSENLEWRYLMKDVL